MTDRERTRRGFLTTTGAGLLVGFAGCSSLSGGPGQGPTNTATTNPPTTATTTTRTTTQAETTTEPDTTTGSETTTDRDKPGYKDYHWHGRLFFEVNGELVDFHQPKYYLDNIQADNPDTVYFHFHQPPENHGPNEWSNEKKVITFARALNLLPGIAYDRKSGSHVVTYEDTTYDARNSGTSISVAEGTDAIDPTSHEVAHGDNYYVQVVSDDAKRNAEPAHSGADLGTLLLDLNNYRVDFSRDRFVGPDAATDAFHFHDDGNPFMWYAEGSVTLADALNALPGIGYEKRTGNHVITYEDEQRSTYSQTYDANSGEHEITVRQRTTPVDPTRYELAAGDVIWVYVHSDAIPENEH